MKIHKILIIFLASLIIVSFYNIHNDYDFLVIFTNKTAFKIIGLKISYAMINNDIEVPEINPKKKIKLKIKPTENFGENSMDILYSDKNGKTHGEILLGYFEKGYKATIKVEISEIDHDGIIKMKIDNNLGILY